MEKFEYRLAKSSAGHDKGSWYAVIPRNTQESGVMYIADGRRRKLDNPKKKNIKHIEITRKTVNLAHNTDKALRKALWEYNFGGSINPESEEG